MNEQARAARRAILATCLLCVSGAAINAGMNRLRGGAESIMPIDRVNPNVASWWELSAIPDLGPAAARRIVAFRDPAAKPARQAFTQAEDLEAVRDIGPRTLQRIERFLRFGGDQNPPANR
ncbi:MAG: helix-hairpin-helix domain-containing protein [Planctomycetota bacterium]